MPIPADLIEWEAKLDPRDIDVYYADLADPAGPLLREGEAVASFTVSLQLESSSEGLQIATAAGYAPVLIDLGRVIQIHLQVDPVQEFNPAFEGAGIALPVTFTVTTDSAPPARRQRSLLVRVKQQ